MRKIAVKEWIQSNMSYSETQTKYTGYFHQWITLENKLYAVIETEDGNIFRCESASVKFIDKC
jgi:hypothetical protein